MQSLQLDTMKYTTSPRLYSFEWVRRNTVKYGTTSLHFVYWLYFLWQDINVYVGELDASKISERYSAMALMLQLRNR